jgi:hypothetical protein
MAGRLQDKIAIVTGGNTASTFVNGHDFVVDGGLVAGRAWTPHQQALAGLRAALGAMSPE